MNLEALLNSYGLMVLFGIFVLEGAMLLYFAPSEGLVPAAIAVFGSEPVTVFQILFVATIGATLGQYLLFYFSKTKGRQYILDHKWLKIKEKHLEKSESWFESYGSGIVGLSNALLFVRGMFTVPAGLSDMENYRFLAFSTLGTLVFETGLALITLNLI